MINIKLMYTVCPCARATEDRDRAHSAENIRIAAILVQAHTSCVWPNDYRSAIFCTLTVAVCVFHLQMKSTTSIVVRRSLNSTYFDLLWTKQHAVQQAVQQVHIMESDLSNTSILWEHGHLCPPPQWLSLKVKK